MDNPFAFLGQAKPAGLFRLLEKLSVEDTAIALAGLSAGVGVQVMAYYPEKVQADLMQAMRDARRVSPERAAQTAARIRDLLLAAKYARDGQANGDAAPPVSPKQPVSAPVKSYAPPPPPAAATRPTAKEPAPRPEVRDKPQPWRPRPATSSPINGPAIPGRPPPVVGDPLKSPLAKAGLLDLIGRAQEKFMPRGTVSARSPASSAPQKPIATKLPPGKRPPAREGVVRSVEIDKRPRVIGPRAAEEAASDAEARRMDGKAILAAILREAGPGIRHTVQDDDPSLFRELKERMFFFDDLIYTEDGALARVFTAAPAEEAALALKFAAPALRDRVLRVVSPGRARALAEVPARRAGMDAIEEAQKKVLDVALQLQAAGRILIDPRDPDLAGN